MTTAERADDAVRDDYADIEMQFEELLRLENVEETRRQRAQIITRCLPLADHIAYRFVGRGEPDDDLIQVARLGLVKVVDRYDPSKGHFLGYAVPTIIGEVRRHFRDNTWAMRVPRRMKETGLRARESLNSLAQRLGRMPTARELATELDVDYEEVVQSAEAAYAYRPLSLDATAPGDDDTGRTLGATQGADDPRYDTIEDVMAVTDAIPELTHREQAILRMRFCDNLTQSQIGDALGISQVHVSRLLSAALDRLRTRLFSDIAAVLPVVSALLLI